VFVDGSFRRTDEARVSVHAHVLSYGTGTFEGIRATWNDKAQELYLLDPAAHYERMHRSANALGLPLPHSTEELVATTVELLRRNEARSDVYLRPLLLLAGEVLGVRMHEVETRLSIGVSLFPARYIDPAGVLCPGQLVAAVAGQHDAAAGEDHVEVDRRPVGNGRSGERTRRLVEALAAIAMRTTDAHTDWTTPGWA
jgi:Amino-transferase class IV